MDKKRPQQDACQIILEAWRATNSENGGYISKNEADAFEYGWEQCEQAIIQWLTRKPDWTDANLFALEIKQGLHRVVLLT